MSMKILATIKKYLTYYSTNYSTSNYSTKLKYYDRSKKLIVGKMTNETAGVAIDEFVALNPKMYSCLANDNSEHKRI